MPCRTLTLRGLLGTTTPDDDVDGFGDDAGGGGGGGGEKGNGGRKGVCPAVVTPSSVPNPVIRYEGLFQLGMILDSAFDIEIQ